MHTVSRNLPEAHRDVAPQARAFAPAARVSKARLARRRVIVGAFCAATALSLAVALGAFKSWSRSAFAAAPPAAAQPTTKKAKVDKADEFFKSAAIPLL